MVIMQTNKIDCITDCIGWNISVGIPYNISIYVNTSVEAVDC